jgi:long-chain fatty acid transport protein
MILFATFLTLKNQAYAGVDQILNNTFFQNPAELSLINKLQLTAGNVFISPTVKFNGVSSGKTGSAMSKVNDYLPYLLTAFRMNDKFVLGVNVTPSAYGHIDWPLDSIVAYESTVTKALYYRAGTQASYQFTEQLAMGMGLNWEYNKLFELDFVIPNQGNQINKISGSNFSADIGLFYKINPNNTLTAAYYTPVNTMGHGTSSLNTTTVNNFSMTISEASVAYVGLQQQLNEKWLIEEVLYWSGWGLQKTLSLANTATGSRNSPTNWRDVWSLQALTHYSATDKVGVLAGITYETNAAPVATNALGYPLAPTLSLSAGVDLSLQKQLSTQLVYGYGVFIPDAQINSLKSVGLVSANTQALVLQLTYQS